MSIEIENKLYHAVRRYMPPGHGDSYTQRLSLPAGASVAQVMANGDVLSIMQPAGGG